MKRRAFTLWEMMIVMTIMALASTLAVPAFVKFGADQPKSAADALLKLLHDARQTAIDKAAIVTLRIDPVTFKYEIDTSTVEGSGMMTTDKVELGPSETIQTDLPRLRFVFMASGAAFGDSVILHGGDKPLWIGVDPWSGVAHADPR